MAKAATARGRKTQEAGVGAPAPADFVNSNDTIYSVETLCVQRLIECKGISAFVVVVILEFARGYAQGLAGGTGWEVSDQATSASTLAPNAGGGA